MKNPFSHLEEVGKEKVYQAVSHHVGLALAMSLKEKGWITDAGYDAILALSISVGQSLVDAAQKDTE